jgi:hypothetical protein
MAPVTEWRGIEAEAEAHVRDFGCVDTDCIGERGTNLEYLLRRAYAAGMRAGADLAKAAPPCAVFRGKAYDRADAIERGEVTP